MKKLHNKVVIVTGGSGLLGKAIIDDLNMHGAFVINLDINVEKDLANGVYYCDITNDQEIEEAIQLILHKYENIHGLVNNAYPRTNDWGTDFEDIDPSSWRRNVDWQLNSYFVISQHVLMQMRKQNEGSIVNIASIYGVVGNDMSLYEGTTIKTAAPYSAIKGGLINLTRYLSSQYGRFNVRINCVSPGGIFDHQDKKFVEAYEKRVPMKRMGNPDDIAPSVSFLLSNESKYITGQNIIVDGGWTAI
ncbi:MAG: SDR family oxidoreductase [Fulvivirga sp.]|uniref:SDR family oxidoreductase n=1 Tax=Fulvivirga sp. TaxID=1931237 RepID=UPI0032EEABB2